MSNFDRFTRDQQPCEEYLNRHHEKKVSSQPKILSKSFTTQYQYKVKCNENELKFNSYHSILSSYTNIKGSYSNEDKHVINKELRKDIDEETVIKQWINDAKSMQNRINLPKIHCRPKCTDKSTYCRPVINYFNQQFLYKTIEKNARLQRIVQDLIIAHQREKEVENWNNYINELKIKHGNNANKTCTASLHNVPKEPVSRSYIKNYYNTKFACKQSDLCHNLLHDVYDAHDIRRPTTTYRTSHDYERSSEQAYYPFRANSYCYPTSSQGRLLILERERQKQLWLNRLYKPLHANKETRLNKDICNMASKKSKTNQKCLFENKERDLLISCDRSTNTLTKNMLTQTEFQMLPISNKLSRNMVKNKANVVSTNIGSDECSNIKTTEENIQSSDIILKQNSLANIEQKLDSLINSINSFLIEMKTQKCTRHEVKKLAKENVNFTKSDSYGLATKEKIDSGLIDNISSKSTINSDANMNMIKNIDNNLIKFNDIILKAMDKNKVLNLKDTCVGESSSRQCTVQISVGILTKEISTEVTRSLSRAEYSSKDKNVLLNEINPLQRDDKRIAIAVNTDPVSVLAFLRVSTEETIRRLLSYVPRIDYYYYLSRLQGPQAVESQYICNICGASFIKPSQLTDHIKKHELGRTRDCCVCRHVLDVSRRRSGLFKCQYCGQRFTRAYCCELHQESCARRLGIPHDIASSLMLLR